MKNIYLLIVLASFCFIMNKTATGQEVEKIKGGTFSTNDAQYWTVGTDKDGIVDNIEFGVTENLPSDATSNTGIKCVNAAGGTTPETQMYQRVDLKAGVTYKLSALIRAKGIMTLDWCQLYIIKDTEPDNGNEFSDAIINVGERSRDLAEFLEAWGMSDKTGEPNVDIDGQMPLCEVGPGTNEITPSEDGTYIVLFKMGGWGTPSVPFEVVLTELSLKGEEKTIAINEDEIIKGGTFSTNDAQYWTVGTDKDGIVDNIEFGVTENLPSDATSNTGIKCVNAAGGTTPETQMYQRVDLKAGVTYKLSALIRAKGIMTLDWCQLYIIKDTEPDNGNEFSDAIINVGERSRDLAEFLEAWGMSDKTGEPNVDIDGQMPLCEVGPGTNEITPSEDGTYIVLFKMGGWGTTSIPFEVVLTELSLKVVGGTSAINETKQKSIEIYPTLVTDFVTIKGVSDRSDIQVYNLLGRSVATFNNFNGRQINLSGLTSGMYIIRVNEGTNHYAQKIRKY